MTRTLSDKTGPLLALASFALFAVHDVIVKLLGGVYSPVQILFFSALFGFPFLTILLIRDKEPGTLRPRHPWWTGARTVLAVVTSLSAFYTFSVLPLAQTYALLFASPLLVTLLSIPILGERVGMRRIIAVVVGLGGVLVVLQPTAETLTPGHIAGLTAAVGSASGGVITRKIGRDERSAVMLAYPMLINILAMGVLLPFIYEPMPLTHLLGMVAIAGLAFVGAALIIMAYRRGAAVTVAPMQYSQIIWASVFGVLLFSEVPTLSTLIGATIIIASGIYIVLREDRRKGDSLRPVLTTRIRSGIGAHPKIGSVPHDNGLSGTTDQPADRQ
ncbi:MAG: DMT family transporter [Qingshengfaniella sp.]